MPNPSSNLVHKILISYTCLLCWAEAPIKIARMILTIKLDGNWSSFQLANSAPPLSVTDSAIAPSARMHARSVHVQAHDCRSPLPGYCLILAGANEHRWHTCVRWCISTICTLSQHAGGALQCGSGQNPPAFSQAWAQRQSLKAGCQAQP